MARSYAARWIIGVIATIALLGVLHFKPWRRGNETARAELSVGFLPVT